MNTVSEIKIKFLTEILKNYQENLDRVIKEDTKNNHPDIRKMFQDCVDRIKKEIEEVKQPH